MTFSFSFFASRLSVINQKEEDLLEEEEYSDEIEIVSHMAEILCQQTNYVTISLTSPNFSKYQRREVV